MLYQKIAALFALMVFAPQGVIGRPQGSISQDIADQLIDPSRIIASHLPPPVNAVAATIDDSGVVDEE